jgi:hypothetical protein
VPAQIHRAVLALAVGKVRRRLPNTCAMPLCPALAPVNIFDAHHDRLHLCRRLMALACGRRLALHDHDCPGTEIELGTVVTDAQPLHKAKRLTEPSRSLG